jgi:hypothetical protein
MTRTTLSLLAILFALFLCCLVSAVAGGLGYWLGRELAPQVEPAPLPTATPGAVDRSLPTPAPLTTPTPIIPTPPRILTPTRPIPTPPPGRDTESLLKTIEVPVADKRDLAARLRPELGEIPLVVNPTPPSYEVGDVLTFWVANTDTDENFQIQAELVVKSEHLYMWVEVGQRVDKRALERSARLFDERIYPTNRAFFGSEWSPGIDNDPRLHVLHATGMGETVAGYFSSADEISSKINPYSNEKEMFYINLDNNRPGTAFYDTTLAHEFQHMIHWYNDLNEETWVNEGLSELAVQLNGMRRSGEAVRPDQVFAADPDVQLTTWPDNEDSFPHYGNAFLFMNYFLSRFGEEATKDLVAQPLNGLEAFDKVLQDLKTGLTADDLFADWVVANWLDDPAAGDGRWHYPDYNPDPMATAAEFNTLPAEGKGDVHQYAADYIRLPGNTDLTVRFTGSTTTRLAATDAYSGYWAWWSHRMDESDTRLTLPVDLSGVDKATLRYRLWYDIEENWDYGYVEVSTDGGKTWRILETARTTRENPQGNAFGPGYTGKSGGTQAEWVLEEVDLTPFAGQPIQIRFEYVTDAAVTMPGMFIDDVAIPEIGYFEDFEKGPGDWQTEGWLLTNNILRQRWLVQAIVTGADGRVRVERMEVGPDGRGELRLQGLDPRREVILAISALAPVTTEVATYRYEVRSGP